MSRGDDSRRSSAALARELMRASDRAALATALATGEAWPYASLVLTACAHDGAPILLLSSLAEHTRNLARDDRVSLLFDGTAGLDDPLTGARVTVLGRALRSDDPAHRARFLARHPAAAGYAGFGDFGIFVVRVERAHLVAGFGRIRWIEAERLLGDAPVSAVLAAAEAEIVTHMNEDHADLLDLYAARLCRRAGTGWRMIGIDCEGIDLRRGGSVARLSFPAPVPTPEAARSALKHLAEEARAGGDQ